jgi:hypothetical protein
LLGTRFPNAVGFRTLVPLLLLGTILVAHYTTPIGAGLLWTAVVLCVIWSVMGFLVLVVSALTGWPTAGWGLIAALITMGPTIPSAIVLYSRRNEIESPRVAS